MIAKGLGKTFNNPDGFAKFEDENVSILLRGRSVDWPDIENSPDCDPEEIH